MRSTDKSWMQEKNKENLKTNTRKGDRLSYQILGRAD
jgi:hypothetical protein